jgi:hypothetical protein
MGAFRRFADFTVARDAAFVALAAATLMLAFSFAPSLALSIGAHSALIFAIGLLLRAAWLSDSRIKHTEAWRILKPQERPVGGADRRSARDDLQGVLLKFAEAASGVAIVLFAASLYISFNTQSRSLQAVLTPSHG